MGVIRSPLTNWSDPPSRTESLSPETHPSESPTCKPAKNLRHGGFNEKGEGLWLDFDEETNENEYWKLLLGGGWTNPSENY